MKNHSTTLTAILLALLTAIAAPAALGATDLLSAWQAARQNNAAFAAARAQQEAGLTRPRQSQALSLPQVSASAGSGYLASDHDTRGAQFSAAGFGSANDAAFRTRLDGGPVTAFTLTAQQSLFNAERNANASQLNHQGQLAEQQFRLAEQDLILQTAQSYFAVLLATDALATLQAQKNAVSHAFDVARERFEAGAAPVTDRDEAQARFDAIVSEELLARDELQLKRTAYADLTGTSAEDLRTAPTNAAFETLGGGALSRWTARAAEHNPLLAMQNLGGAIARDELEKFRARMAPSLDLIARLSDERMSGANGLGGTTRINANTQTIVMQLTIPLYTGGMRDAKRNEAAALLRKAEFDTQSLREEILRQTQASWLGVNTGITRIKAQTQALRSAQSRLNATTTGLEVGARTTLDLMNAQADYYQAQRNLAQVKYQLLLDRLRLSAVAGELAEAQLREVNALLAAAETNPAK